MRCWRVVEKRRVGGQSGGGGEDGDGDVEVYRLRYKYLIEIF